MSVKAAVRYDAQTQVGVPDYWSKDDPKHLLYIKVDKIGELQMKALPIFIPRLSGVLPRSRRRVLGKVQNISRILYKLKKYKIWL